MRKLTLLLLTLLLAVATVACSDDDDGDSAKKRDDKTPTSTTTTALELAPEQIDTEASEYCAVWAQIRSVGALENQEPETVKRHYGELVPVVERLVEAADDDIKPDAETSLRLTREVAQSGSLDTWSTPDAQQLGERLGRYARENCLKR